MAPDEQHFYKLEALEPQAVADTVARMVSDIATRVRFDVIQAISDAIPTEQNDRARRILQMIVDNDAIARQDRVPVCQDTGSVWVYLELGEQEKLPANIFSLVDAAVANAFEQSKLRKSILADALVERVNTQTNTPAFKEIAFKLGRGAKLHVMLKGGGSDNASRVVMLAPGAGLEGITEQLISCVVEKASSACPPLVIGLGVGATFDKVAALAKKALLRPIGQPNADERVAEIEAKLLDAVNATGIGPAGLGGNTTAVGLSIETAPCHIAALPLAINMGCCAMRSASAVLEAE